MPDEDRSPWGRTKQSLWEGINNFRAAVGHLLKAYEDLKESYPFTVKTTVVLFVAYIIDLLKDVLPVWINAAMSSISTWIGYLVPDEISVVSIIVGIFYLQLVNMVMFLITFNYLAVRLSNVENQPKRSDGGEPVEGGLAPRWAWVVLVLPAAALGGLIGSQLGETGLIFGVAIGGLLGDELYRRADNGSLFGIRADRS